MKSKIQLQRIRQRGKSVFGELKQPIEIATSGDGVLLCHTGQRKQRIPVATGQAANVCPSAEQRNGVLKSHEIHGGLHAPF